MSFVRIHKGADYHTSFKASVSSWTSRTCWAFRSSKISTFNNFSNDFSVITAAISFRTNFTSGSIFSVLTTSSARPARTLWSRLTYSFVTSSRTCFVTWSWAFTWRTSTFSSIFLVEEPTKFLWIHTNRTFVYGTDHNTRFLRCRFSRSHSVSTSIWTLIITSCRTFVTRTWTISGSK